MLDITPPKTSGPKLPHVKLNELGDAVVMVIAHVDYSAPDTDYDTGERKYWYKRKPTIESEIPDNEDLDSLDMVTQTVVTGIVKSSAGNAQLMVDGDSIDPEPGEVVSLFLAGGKNSNQSRFNDELRRVMRGIPEGDKWGMVLQYRFDTTEPASNPKWNDRKIMGSSIRPGTDEEKIEHKAKIEEIVAGQLSAPQVAAPDTSVADHFGGSAVGNEDPFRIDAGEWMPGHWGSYPTRIG